MSKHVAPHRWADLFAGRIEAKQSARMERHAESCPRCATIRSEVRRATDTFAAIRDQPAPAVGWDSVRARVHWSVSTAKHRRVELRRISFMQRRLVVGGLGALVLFAAGVFAYCQAQFPISHDVAVANVPSPTIPTAIHGLVTRLAGEVLIDGVRPSSAAAAFRRTIGAGTLLATGDGRIDVQFGEASAIALGPRTSLRFIHLDSSAIELAVDGIVDIDVRRRAGGERFAVVAGSHTIEVRGTRFMVQRDARGTRVACQHGLVSVRDIHRATSLDVGAGRTAFIAGDRPPTNVEAAPLGADEIARFARSEPWITPVWTPDLVTHSAALDITAVTRRNVRVDGMEVGPAPLQMRVMLGRHTIEIADSVGRFHRAGWVDVNGDQPAAFEVVDLVTQPSSADVAQRKKQFAVGIDRARLLACTRRLAKSGLTDTVKIEISVDALGSVNMLNIIDTDLPADSASCVHRVLSDVHFRSGPAATWRDQITL